MCLCTSAEVRCAVQVNSYTRSQCGSYLVLKDASASISARSLAVSMQADDHPAYHQSCGSLAG